MLDGRLVPDYRCGAVPEWPESVMDAASPASLFILRRGAAGTDGPNIVGCHGIVNTKYCVEPIFFGIGEVPRMGAPYGDAGCTDIGSAARQIETHSQK